MLILSLNLRGVGGAPKSLALQRLLTSLSPDFILFQETMTRGVTVCNLLWNILLEWECCSIDSVGLSGGLLAA